MILEKFRVTNFRSIADSDWVTTSNITTVIGENESGKTNLLLPLLKLNPAAEDSISKIDLIKDYPRKSYSDLKKDPKLVSTSFVQAVFLLDDEDKKAIKKILEVDDDICHIHIERCYDGNCFIAFHGKGGKIDIADGILDKPRQGATESRFAEIMKLIPKFMYYAEYEKLDSDIYLPTASASGQSDRKARTLKTLFDFVGLKPDEILQMGQRSNYGTHDIDLAKKNNERQILLSSAATTFSDEFKKWWGQGEYRFKFEADGDYFRIKISDSIRSEELELESRSAGLQWFFSFFLVFLVESKKKHKNTILLLDEPGLTLHPNAQKDLYNFFETLSKGNQLVYTTHSPFMINSNQLDKVYAAYIDEKTGHSKITADLRAAGNKGKQLNSIYPAHAALGLSVSDTLLHGCYPVIVEGVSDQIYYGLLKNALIDNGKLKTEKEIVFIPSGGTSGVKPVLQILTGLQNEEYPFVLLDGDTAGQESRASLTGTKGIYKGNEGRVICLTTPFSNAEVEDLMPFTELTKIVSEYLPKPEDFGNTFNDTAISGTPICDQIKKYTDTIGYEFNSGDKVEIAKKFKRFITSKRVKLWDKLDNAIKTQIEAIFNAIIGVEVKPKTTK